VVDEQAMTVSPRSVKVGRVLDRRIEVFEGIEPGDRIVIAGTPFLAEGMQVTLMAAREQAAPRPEDLQYQQ
jgi:multidrug efflux pump subunit AcrA (membrane-fusion protein)